MYIINELPGVYFKENSSYELDGTGSKIPIFIGATGNSTSYDFVSYDNNDNEIGEGTVKLTGIVDGDYTQVEVLTNSTVQDYVGQNFYVKSDAVTDGKKKTDLYTDAGSTLAGIKVAIKDTYRADGTSFLTFDKIKSALQPVQTTGENWEKKTGIGLATDKNNKLAQFINDFYDESKLKQSTDIGVQYIYIIDVGDGKSVTAWENALETAKTLTDAQVEIYIGAEEIEGCTFEEFIYKAVDSIYEDTEELDLRYGFSYLEKTDGETLKEYDTRLINLANNLRLHYGTELQKLSRFGLCEDLLVGKTLARICCTPYNVEPGFLVYRSVTPNTFRKRLKEDMLDLQNAGIIFNRDEQVNGTKYPRINLCVSASFTGTKDRPTDSLFHARFNSDDLLREVFEVCFTQIKNNETAVNLAYLQALIDVVVADRVSNDEMILYDETTERGTRLIVKESDEEPYNLMITGQLHPVKCTIAIKVEAKIII